MHHPPVNSLTVGDTWQIGEEFEALGRRDDVRCIILTAEGKGFNAGIDIKEMQSRPGLRVLLVVGRGVLFDVREDLHVAGAHHRRRQRLLHGPRRRPRR